jgi:Cellulose biosynthesis protein BcsS
LALSLASPLAIAEDRLALGGFEYSGAGSYAYAGVIMPITKQPSDSRFVQKYWLDWLTYSYDKNGQSIDAKAAGLEAALGYQISGHQGWGGLYIGGLVRNTELSPDDMGNGARGTKLRLKLQADGELTPEHWRLAGIASYIVGQNAFWLRARVLHDLRGHLWTGPELIYQGDPTYRRTQVGWVIEGFKIAGGVTLGIKAGASKNAGESTEAYMGLEIARWF